MRKCQCGLYAPQFPRVASWRVTPLGYNVCMRLIRCAVCTALLLGLSGGAAHAQFVDFLKSSGETLESHTGLWFGTWMTSNTPKLPIETLTRATKEAVTGGVALKVIARPGSIGRISYEHERGTTFSPAILTFYAKASRNVSLRVFRSTIPATFTAPFNITGQPGISLPLHQSTEGLPIGMQLVAAPAREDVLIRVAAQLEQARPWPLFPATREVLLG